MATGKTLACCRKPVQACQLSAMRLTNGERRDKYEGGGGDLIDLVDILGTLSLSISMGGREVIFLLSATNNEITNKIFYTAVVKQFMVKHGSWERGSEMVSTVVLVDFVVLCMRTRSVPYVIACTVREQYGKQLYAVSRAFSSLFFCDTHRCLFLEG